MPKLIDNNMEVINTNSNYGFSAVKMDQLGASEYTLVTLVLDRSGSLAGKERDLEKMMIEALKSCKKSPRAENLMVRTLLFNDREDELHGFRLLNSIDEKEYDNIIITGGMTKLFDSTHHAIESTLGYSKILTSQDYVANGIIFIITDGCDNDSKYTPNSIKTLIDGSKKSEVIESINTVLIGMTGDAHVNNNLQIFAKDAEITQYVDMGDVTTSKLAKLASFISQSISSTSQALGTGGPSASLTF